jgi:hypothetical protein
MLILFVNWMLLNGLKEMENIGPHTDNHTCNWLLDFGWEVMSHIPNSFNNLPNDFHLTGLIEKQLAGKWFAADAYVKQDLASWLHILDVDLFYTIMQTLVPYWDKRLMCGILMYPSTTVKVRVSVKFSAGECLLPDFLDP